MSDAARFSGICWDCGTEHGKPVTIAGTYHFGRCFCCGETKSVTSLSDFGYPDFPPHPDYQEQNSEQV